MCLEAAILARVFFSPLYNTTGKRINEDNIDTLFKVLTRKNRTFFEVSKQQIFFKTRLLPFVNFNCYSLKILSSE